jgi:hypothetical protein
MTEYEVDIIFKGGHTTVITADNEEQARKKAVSEIDSDVLQILAIEVRKVKDGE